MDIIPTPKRNIIMDATLLSSLMSCGRFLICDTIISYVRERQIQFVEVGQPNSQDSRSILQTQDKWI